MLFFSAEEGSLLAFIVKMKNKYDAPYVEIIISLILCITLVLKKSFEQLSVMSVIARFAQYIPTGLSVIVLRKIVDIKVLFKIPFGLVIPIVAILGSLWWLQ
ncbi:amino acid transporter [Clostridioides difficile]|nr:amino acid transporter [Clostridioides difficile]